jgi:uncharacterized protein (TIGR02598 family)
MKRTPARVSAFSLVEVTLALGIAGFALMAIFGLLPVGLNSNRTSIEQTRAMDIATSIAADLRATATNETVSPKLGISIPAAGSSSSSIVYLEEAGGPFPAPTAVSNKSRYRADITMTAPAGTLRTATFGTATLSWPAQALPVNAAGSASAFIALDRN